MKCSDWDLLQNNMCGGIGYGSAGHELIIIKDRSEYLRIIIIQKVSTFINI